MAGGLLLQPSYTEDIKYAAYQDRLLIKSLAGQAGVVEKEDYKVSAGSGTQVNVKSGKAFIEQTKAIEESSNTFYNGLYSALNPSEQNPYNSVEVSTVNPQIAQIILRVYDVNELKIGGSSYGRIEWLNGSPTSGATKVHMEEGKYEGAAALPQSSLRIARILVPKNATTSTEYYIEDARNFYFPLFNSSNRYTPQVPAVKNIVINSIRPTFVSLECIFSKINSTGTFTTKVQGVIINSQSIALSESNNYKLASTFICPPAQEYSWESGNVEKVFASYLTL